MKPASYPVATHFSSGVFLDGKVRMCGGKGTAAGTNCFEYAVGDDSWTSSEYALPEERYRHVSEQKCFKNLDFSPVFYFIGKLHSGQWFLVDGWRRDAQKC